MNAPLPSVNKCLCVCVGGWRGILVPVMTVSFRLTFTVNENVCSDYKCLYCSSVCQSSLPFTLCETLKLHSSLRSRYVSIYSTTPQADLALELV